ncbi:MAG: hypothetical protein ACYTGS_04070 [Planctomycetota bacterium]|jgi:hypothetical protein
MNVGPPSEPECPTCDEEMDILDIIVNRRTRKAYHLWVCHNEDCEDYGSIWNDAREGDLRRGDPAGLY